MELHAIGGFEETCLRPRGLLVDSSRRDEFPLPFGGRLATGRTAVHAPCSTYRAGPSSSCSFSIVNALTGRQRRWRRGRGRNRENAG